MESSHQTQTVDTHVSDKQATESTATPHDTSSQSTHQDEEEKKQYSTDNPPTTSKQEIFNKAFQFKEEGNLFFKAKDYKRALAKYARVECYTRVLCPSKEGEMAMYGNMNKKAKELEANDEEIEKVNDLLATTYVNMSICFYLQQLYQKSLDKASKSVSAKPTVKGYYRRGKAQMQLEHFAEAAKDFEAAVRLDPSDPNDIQQELALAKIKAKEREKANAKKMQGFLLRGDKE
eukprot:403350887